MWDHIYFVCANDVRMKGSIGSQVVIIATIMVMPTNQQFNFILKHSLVWDRVKRVDAGISSRERLKERFYCSYIGIRDATKIFPKGIRFYKESRATITIVITLDGYFSPIVISQRVSLEIYFSRIIEEIYNFLDNFRLMALIIDENFAKLCF